MPTHIEKSDSRGSTLIEVIIATTFIVFILLALASSFSLVLRNQRNSTNQQQATKYGQEALEWIRQVRDSAGWQTFYDAVYTGDILSGRTTHCIASIPAVTVAAYTALPDSATCGSTEFISNEQTKNQYFRTLIFSRPSIDEIQVRAVVSWIDGNRTMDSTATLSLWKWSR